MSVEILTKEDLIRFKVELISEFKNLMNEKNEHRKKWLRSKEVEKLLNISPGTLQNYRINGTIKWTKFGNTYFYSLDAIQQSFESNSSSFS
ncbi:hypothetical protein KO02_08375 [Sphingobacterium sp. ML3W]|uniref:helix-turn-helix domain-containing protein n=1 Tax=Sphingobacterium sp. ML3W TaxID=1538644 RepID=UPI0004F59385|nr:helix-turn-helix domain-containing protein [Sphingobacterium sp. ML3W]AIM36717.1 hypothetical protein KO02_08375 [Sphingobacterium sp. ML3W]